MVTEAPLTSVYSKWEEEEAVLVMTEIPWVKMICCPPSKWPGYAAVMTRLNTSGLGGHKRGTNIMKEPTSEPMWERT